MVYRNFKDGYFIHKLPDLINKYGRIDNMDRVVDIGVNTDPPDLEKKLQEIDTIINNIKKNIKNPPTLNQNPTNDNKTINKTINNTINNTNDNTTDDNDNDKELIIVERKTINDLASSIRDNRYNEQSYRLTECELHNHYIYYLIEGGLSNLNHRVNKQSILSAITSLSYFKGFSVYRTLSVTESAEWLIRCADKIGRETKKPYYSI